MDDNEILECLRKLKDVLMSDGLDSLTEQDVNIQTLIKIDKSEVDIKLWETIVLLHSNYKAANQANMGMYLRTIIKLIDTQIDYINIKRQPEKTKASVLTNPLAYSVVVATTVIGVGYLVKVFSTDHEAAQMAVEFFKTIFSILV